MSALDLADVATEVVTVTSTLPTAWAGVWTVIEVEVGVPTTVAVALPKCTVAEAVKFVPVMVTVVPPAVEPEDELRLVTVGVVLGVV
jgi:hypothetical protein